MGDVSDRWPHCGARTRSGAPCRGPAVQGSQRCRMHGGTTSPRANARKLAVQKMSAYVQQYGLPREIDPSDALQEEIDRTAGIVEFLAAKLRDAGAGDMVERITVETSAGDSQYVMRRTESAVGPWLELFLAERKHLAKISVDAVRLGLEEQRLEIDRRHAVAMEAGVLYLVARLGLSAENPDVRAALGATFAETSRVYRTTVQQAALPITHR